MTVLVTGGAGYIGSHMVWALLDAGEDVVVLDRLSTGFRWAVPDEARFYLGDVGDRELLRRIFAENSIDAVLHFAGSIVVPQSVLHPLEYYENNTSKTGVLASAAIEAGIENFVFSSTAAVYGDNVGEGLVRESDPTYPKNPYGQSKLMSEMMLRDAANAHPFRYVVLRYFNVAGADPQGRTGLSTQGATHLIKLACEAALGRREALDVYGTDYPTVDGTGVRDYIHVSDLVAAHLNALAYLRRGGGSMIANCGYGAGYSVLQVVESVKRVHGQDFRVRFCPRRPGDTAAVVADSSRAREILGWRPRHANLDHIIATALDWEETLQARRQGDLTTIHRRLAASF
ncbi:UDP-glucose 4-epimerase GalE [Rhizobium helianthi]|uniref:UDP-glucose 4-epimerase n=1 Tax=Rhizobium helianthi TaxID=1132695 RepID=A0ABW4M200_9HYPH